MMGKMDVRFIKFTPTAGESVDAVYKNTNADENEELNTLGEKIPAKIW